ALKTRSLRTSEDAKKIFFFSSRRRHTRFSRDWSSDVCSSDLPHQRIKERLTDLLFDPHSLCRIEGSGMHFPALIERGCQRTKVRSEERRVGKECSSRWSLWQAGKEKHIAR